MFQFRIPWKSYGAGGTVGLKLGVTFPAAISFGIVFRGPITNVVGNNEQTFHAIASGDFNIVSTSAPTGPNNYAFIDGTIYTSVNGTLHVLYGAEAACASGVTLMPGACGIMWAMV